jgi:hypothetical protein
MLVFTEGRTWTGSARRSTQTAVVRCKVARYSNVLFSPRAFFGLMARIFFAHMDAPSKLNMPF